MLNRKNNTDTKKTNTDTTKTTAKIFGFFKYMPREIIQNIARDLAYCSDLANLRITSKLMNEIVESTQSGKLAREAINSISTPVDSFFAKAASNFADLLPINILGTGNYSQFNDLKKGEKRIENLKEKQKTIKEILSEPENSPQFLK